MQRNAIIVFLGILFLVFSYIANLSLRKLSVRSSSYYDFGRVFPHAGRWAVIVYIIGIAILLFIFAFFGKISLTASPA